MKTLMVGKKYSLYCVAALDSKMHSDFGDKNFDGHCSIFQLTEPKSKRLSLIRNLVLFEAMRSLGWF